MSFEDKFLQCSDCRQQFTFTSGEQEFYKTKGLINEPKRCPACRRINKGRRSAGNNDGSRW